MHKSSANSPVFKLVLLGKVSIEKWSCYNLLESNMTVCIFYRLCFTLWGLTFVKND